MKSTASATGTPAGLGHDVVLVARRRLVVHGVTNKLGPRGLVLALAARLSRS